MNKRNLWKIVLWTVLASGCSPAEVTVPDDHAIRFGGLEVSRKVIDNKSSFSDGDAMTVFGVEHQGDISQQYHVFDNTPVTLWGSSWGYDAKAYWMEGHSYCFRAFYPHPGSLPNHVSPYQLVTDFGTAHHYDVQHFTVSRNTDEQVDLMVSDVITRGPIDYQNPLQMQPVSFSFNHLLTNIHLTVKAPKTQQGMSFRLTNIRLVGMKSTGDCHDGQWDTAASETDIIGFRRAFSAEQGTVDDKGLDIWPYGLLLIPQDITPDMKLVIDFVVTRIHSEPGQPDQTITSKDSRTIPLTTEPLWQKSSRIDYVATIDSDSDISLFVAKVVPWEVVENSHNIIVK